VLWNKNFQIPEGVQKKEIVLKERSLSFLSGEVMIVDPFRTCLSALGE